MKIEQVFNVCSVYSQRNYLTSADYSNAYQSRGYPLNKKEVKKMNELKKIPTAQLIEELSNREDVDSYTTAESYGILHKAKNVDKRYPTGTIVLFVNPQGRCSE